jgi:hypothetical protein
VFGPQALSFNTAAFHMLQSKVMQMKNKSWILNAIAELPQCWHAFLTEFPKYDVGRGTERLKNFGEWFKTGKPDQDFQHLPNIILSPLVVITHLTEYMKYLDTVSPESEQHEEQPELSTTEIVGFCTGFLSALVASVSKDRRQVQQYGAIAIRLAMLIGGVVDAQDQLDKQGTSKSFATSWTSSKAAEEMNRILQRFPEVSNFIFHLLSMRLTRMFVCVGIYFC